MKYLKYIPIAEAEGKSLEELSNIALEQGLELSEVQVLTAYWPEDEDECATIGVTRPVESSTVEEIRVTPETTKENEDDRDD